ncbi:hypothetical protein MM440_12270 [Arsenicicoccus piscis]|nr:hypothetical protein [Arsenicicoccus piscis]MCH8628520.1 hypothetical protein [Arsenicicoccus piscis]
MDGNHLRRRLFFGLPAAERAVERARERGADAELILCELHAVGVVA